MRTASFAFVVAPAALGPLGVRAPVAVELLAALRVPLVRAVTSPSGGTCKFHRKDKYESLGVEFVRQCRRKGGHPEELTAFLASVADTAALTVLGNGALGIHGKIASGPEGETVPTELEGASDESCEAEKERMIATHRSSGRGPGGPGQGRLIRELSW